MNQTNKQWLAWILITLATLAIALFFGVQYPIPAEPTEPVEPVPLAAHFSNPVDIEGSASASAPALTFEGDTDTGIYRSAANTLKMASGGADVLTVNSTGLTIAGDVIPSGAVTAGSATINGNATVTGTLDVTGNTTITGTFTTGSTNTLGGNTTVSGNATVNGNAVVTGTADITGNTEITGTLTVGGDATFDDEIIQGSSTASGSNATGLGEGSTAGGANSLAVGHGITSGPGQFAITGTDPSDTGLTANQSSIWTLSATTTFNDDSWNSLGTDAWDGDWIPLPADAAMAIDALVIGYDASDNVSAYHIHAAVYDNAGSAAVATQSVTVIHEDDADFDCQIAVTGNTFTIQVKDSTSGGATTYWTATVHTAELHR